MKIFVPSVRVDVKPYNMESIFMAEEIAVIPLDTIQNTTNVAPDISSVSELISSITPELEPTKTVEEKEKKKKYKGKHAHLDEVEFNSLMAWVEQQTLCPDVPKEARLHMLEWLQDLIKECQDRCEDEEVEVNESVEIIQHLYDALVNKFKTNTAIDGNDLVRTIANLLKFTSLERSPLTSIIQQLIGSGKLVRKDIKTFTLV